MMIGDIASCCFANLPISSQSTSRLHSSSTTMMTNWWWWWQLKILQLKMRQIQEYSPKYRIFLLASLVLYIWLLIYLMAAVVSSAVYLYLPAALYLFFQLVLNTTNPTDLQYSKPHPWSRMCGFDYLFLSSNCLPKKPTNLTDLHHRKE